MLERRAMRIDKRAVGLLFWAFLSLSVSAAAAGPAEQAPEAVAEAPSPRTYAHFDIEGSIPETLPPLYLLEPDMETFYDLTDRIERAIQDPAVSGLIVKIGAFDAGWAKVQEVRDALFRCRRAGKGVVCFLEGGGNLTYYLASAADRIVLIPSGSLMVVGLRAEVLFLKGLLDLVGLKGDIMQVGKYKGAAEPFTRTEASESFRESMDSLVEDFYRQFTVDIARARDMEPKAVTALIDRGPFTAKDALEAGLVDDVMYYDELLEDLRKKGKGKFRVVKGYGAREPAQAIFSGPQQILRMLMGMAQRRPQARAGAPKAIAIIYVVGPIIMAEPDEFSIGEYVVSAPLLIKAIRKAKERDDIRAIVLRVDSPGGSAVASDMVWRELRQADKVKPVVVSLSDVAGSGGYYVAAGGRSIIAGAGTITGSIGVVGGKFVVKGLFEKLGLNVQVFQRGRHAGFLSAAQEFSDSERERMRALLLSTYETFLSRVAETRNMPVEDVRSVAAGRPWSGFQAKRKNLVDALGGLSDAIAEAKKAAGIAPDEKVEIIRLPRPRSVLELLFHGKENDSAMLPAGLQNLLPGAARARSYLNTLRCLEKEPTAFIMPGLITVE